MPAGRVSNAVRHVAVVGPAGVGKTTLVRAMLARAGGAAEDGTTVAAPTTSLAVDRLDYDAITVNLIDTPGDPDFDGALRAGLRAADAVLFVVSGVDGVDARTVQLWEECELARAVVVTGLDRPGADFDEAAAICQRVFGEGVHPLALPLLADDESVAGLIGLLDQRVSDWSSGERVRRDPEPQHLPLIDNLRADLVEAVIAGSEDEGWLDRYLDGEEPGAERLAGELGRAVAQGVVRPVLPAAPTCGVGTDEVLELVTRAFPGPTGRALPPVARPDGSPALPLRGDPDGPLAAEVVQISRRPGEGRRGEGRRCLVRVFSGTVIPGMAVLTGTVEGLADEQVGRVGTAGDLSAGPSADLGVGPAGDLGAGRAGDLYTVGGLQHARVGDMLSSPADPLVGTDREFAEPLLPVALLPIALAGDEEGLDRALAEVVADDPVARSGRDPQTGQLLLWATGERHAEVLLDELTGRIGSAAVRVAVQTTPEGDDEPVSELTVRVPSWAAGAVVTDLRSHRGRVTAREAGDDGTVVRAEVPDRELIDYATRLLAISQGTGTAQRRFLRHQASQE